MHSSFKTGDARDVEDLARRLFRPRAGQRVALAIREETRDDGECVVAIVFLSTNASSSDRVPGVTERREVVIPFARHRGANPYALDPQKRAHAKAIEQLHELLTAELSHTPQPPQAPRPPDFEDLRLALIRAEIAGDDALAEQIQGEIITLRLGLSHGSPARRPAAPTRHGEMILDARDVPTADPPKGWAR
jgi:hypothetical protein